MSSPSLQLLALPNGFIAITQLTTSHAHMTNVPDKENFLANISYLHIQQLRSNIIRDLESCLCPTFTVFYFCFWFLPIPEGNICLISC